VKRVLVTGATGFIGQHVIPCLLEYGYEVIAVARDETKARTFAWFDRVNFISCDIHKPIKNPVEMLGQPEAVIHLAWPGLPNYKSLFHFEKNLPAAYRFLKALIEDGVNNVLVTGTCFEYGIQSGSLKEDMHTQPTNPYGFAKDMLYQQLQYLKNEKSFTLTWARLFYVYGEGQAENSLLPQLKKAVEQGEEVFNMSGGEQERDYLPIADVAKYLVSLATRNKDNGIVNVCSGKPVTVRDLVESWIQENGWSIKLNLGYYPYPDYEPMAFWGDRQKLDRCLGKP